MKKKRTRKPKIPRVRVHKGPKDLSEAPAPPVGDPPCATPVQRPPVKPTSQIELKIEVDKQSNTDTASLVLESDAEEDFADIPILTDSSDECEPASNRHDQDDPEEEAYEGVVDQVIIEL